MKKMLLCFIVVLGCVAMTLVDGIIQPGYFIKSTVKLVFFLAIPLLFSKKLKLSFSGAFRPKRQSIIIGSVLGVAAFCVILGAYRLLHPHLDLSGVVHALESTAGVTKDNFLFVGTYIALCNSLLEEFFFRYFAFLGLERNGNKLFAYIFSAAAFAIYHAGMLITMVAPLLFALALVALFACGLLLNYLNGCSQTIWVSWLLHMGANLAINTVGMILLGIL